MNTPGGNAISVAEHTLALMLAMARHIPQANASTRAGKWEKKKFMGNELRGKTLGIVGLGSIGREVVKRARAFEMRIVAHDPYVTSTIAHDLGVELLDLPKLYAAERLHHAARGGHAGNAGHALARGLRADEGRRAHRQLRARRTGGRSRAGRGARQRQSGRRRAGRLQRGTAAGRLPAVRGGWRAGHAAHRRLHRRGAGDRRRAHRRAGGGIPDARRRHQRGQHAARCRPSSIARWAPTRRWPSGWATSRRTSPAAIRIRCACTTSARSPTATPTCCATRGWPAC